MADPSSRRKLAAILSADVVGYSRLMAANEAATVETLKSYRGIITRLVVRHGGRVVNAPGDALLAEFPSAVEAVQAAIEIQQSVEGHNVELEADRRMQFRIGVNLGDVIEEADGTIYGDGVNIAARLEALAEGGGVCISSTVYDAVEGKLALGFDFLGEHQVKNIAKPIRVYRARAEPKPPSTRARSKRSMPWRIAVPVLALILALLGAAGAWNWSSPPVSPLPEKGSIAVLPFDNIGGDAKWDRFADGITEDIITDLSHSKDLIVIARNSTEVYKGKPVDIRQIGRDLNVEYVLEGSIQPLDERIRVTAQLVEADSGSHIWSERYDRPVEDLFAVQNDVTQRIAATIAGSEGAVAEAERSLIRRKPPANLTAFDTYLLGMEAKHKVTKEALIEAEGLYRKAIELDPQLARAYYGLATVQMYLIDLGFAPSVDEALSTMMEAAEKAVQLDPDDGKTHLALGGAYAYYGKAEQALAEFDRAEALSPSDADLLLVIAWTIPGFGQSARAVSLAEQALKLNPRYPDWYNQGLSYVFFFGEQYDKSVKYRLLVKEPVALDYAFLAMGYAYLGRTGDAEAAAANVKKLDPTWIAERYLSDGGGYAEKEAELFVDGARKAGLPDCVPADKLKDMPNLIHVKSCDQQRAKITG
ncbi:adenylate/guanylate cyclase domain-containing protein [Methyloceanibacter sp.]|uniref:adenylate/guanylate cyclase domain-containing protein n=1 Tax=Methyloceanibacter sp. TaxID=1965321 RepID=UPI003D6D5B68